MPEIGTSLTHVYGLQPLLSCENCSLSSTLYPSLSLIYPFLLPSLSIPLLFPFLFIFLFSSSFSYFYSSFTVLRINSRKHVICVLYHITGLFLPALKFIFPTAQSSFYSPIHLSINWQLIQYFPVPQTSSVNYPHAYLIIISLYTLSPPRYLSIHPLSHSSFYPSIYTSIYIHLYNHSSL